MKTYFLKNSSTWLVGISLLLFLAISHLVSGQEMESHATARVQVINFETPRVVEAQRPPLFRMQNQAEALRVMLLKQKN